MASAGPDGLFLLPWEAGCCLFCDFTCPDTFATSHFYLTVTGNGAVATEAEAKKLFVSHVDTT